MKDIYFHPDIFHEIKDAYDWYEAKSSGLGELFLAELESAFSTIGETPVVWAKVSGEFRRYLLKRFPFGVLYRIEKSKLYVVAIMHLNRKPGYWKKRLRSK